jgi:putative copper resistance protein D
MTPLQVITQATFPPIPTVLIALMVGWYLWSVRRLAAKGRKWSNWRTASFCFAAFLLAVGLCSGIDAHDENFVIHTIQHILISMLAPLFLALSGPITLLLQSSNRKVQTTVLKILHTRVAKVLTNPIFTWSFYGLSLYTLYFSSLYALTLRDPLVHNLVHVHLIFAGCLFWWPVAGVDPLPNRLSPMVKIFYLLLALPFHTILGMALESQTNPITPTTSLSQLHAGGGLMWVSGEAIGLLGTLVVFVQWLRADEREARRVDRVSEAAAAQQLAHWRATRDAAARAISN